MITETIIGLPGFISWYVEVSVEWNDYWNFSLHSSPSCYICRSISRMKWLLKPSWVNVEVNPLRRSISRMKWLLKLNPTSSGWRFFVEVSVEWNDYWNKRQSQTALSLKCRSISRMKWLLKLASCTTSRNTGVEVSVEWNDYWNRCRSGQPFY